MLAYDGRVLYMKWQLRRLTRCLYTRTLDLMVLCIEQFFEERRGGRKWNTASKPNMSIPR